jgi:hypothetical protein
VISRNGEWQGGKEAFVPNLKMQAGFKGLFIEYGLK